MTTIATICARGGSVGVPRKNIRSLMGLPLIAHSIKQALDCDFIDDVYVSTDDEEIAEVAKKYGATVPFLRPAELATSGSAKIPVIQHLVDFLVVEGLDIQTIIDLDPTSPLRSHSDITGAFALLDHETDVVITGYESDKNPYFNMVEHQSDGNVRLVKTPKEPVLGRQGAPKVFSMNASIYIWHRETLGAGLWDGRTKIFEMPRERSIDLDSEIDFQLIDFLMKRKEADQHE